MNVGMLWFDNDPKVGLDTKLERAADYYRKKYGRVPTLCFVHPRMLNNQASGQPVEQTGNGHYVSRGIEVRPNRSVLPNHFWIGVNGTSEAEPGRS
jgi:hypothetical protein